MRGDITEDLGSL